VALVLDFDSILVAPPVIALTNGTLQLSIVGGRPNPADRPDYFGLGKLRQFLTVHREKVAGETSLLNEHKLLTLPDLTIETMISEAVLSIAATGFFGHCRNGRLK
jgi:hypothetical protein